CPSPGTASNASAPSSRRSGWPPADPAVALRRSSRPPSAASGVDVLMIQPFRRIFRFTRRLAQSVARRAVPASELDSLRRRRASAIEAGQWDAALEPAERIAAATALDEGGDDATWVAVVHYELGREAMGRGQLTAAATQFRAALRADRNFVPATLALGDALDAAGGRGEALRTWERAVDIAPSSPVLARLERVYRDEGRPSRMIALYRAAAQRAPDDVALAVELGRVYFDLEMLDEAADQFEKIEVRAPDLPVVHAFLGAVFERRGETREAFAEYRRAVRLGDAFEWAPSSPPRGAPPPAPLDSFPRCRRWNTVRPAPGR